MKPLVTQQQVLTWLCIYPADKSTSKWLKRAYVIFSVAVVVANSLGLITSVAYVYKFISIDLESSLCSILQIVATLSTSYAYILFFTFRHKIVAFFINLSDIYKQRANDDSFRYLAQANNKSEWIWILFFKYLKFGYFICNVITALSSMLLCWLMHGEIITNHLYQPYKLV